MSTTILGQKVGPVGFGLMGFTWRPQQIPRAEAIKTMKEALSLGANYWNAGEFYGTPESNSLHLLHDYFTQYPEDSGKVVLSIKGATDMTKMAPDGSPEGVRRSIDNCLRVLDGTKKIDVFECARVDPNVPIEVSIAAIAEYVKAGKVGGIGISEVSEKSIRRAAKVHPIAAVELELSLFSTELLVDGTGLAAAELGIPVVAYSPLGRGFLTGQLKRPEDLPAGDMRHHMPRFQKEVFHENLKLAEAVDKIAKRKGCTSAQIAIGWVMAQSAKIQGNPAILPIPGATTIARVRENLKPVQLSDQELAEIEGVLQSIPVQGARYGGAHAKYINA